MSDKPSSLLEALQSFGFTSLEAGIYTALVRSPGSTGYAVAKQLLKPTANVYKALEGLTAKGAALTEDGPEKRFTAIPPAELVGRFEQAVKRRGQTIVDRLKDPAPPASVDAIYSLHTREQADERIASILRSAKTALVVDASPQALERWAPQLEAEGRDKRVLVKAYAPQAVGNCSMFVDPRGEEIQRRWRAQWFHVAGDGVEVLLSIYAGDALARGLWTREPLVAVVYHEALTSEILLSGLTDLIGDDEAHRPLRAFLDRHFGAVRLDTEGLDRLIRRFQDSRS